MYYTVICVGAWAYTMVALTAQWHFIAQNYIREVKLINLQIPKNVASYLFITFHRPSYHTPGPWYDYNIKIT